MPKLIPLLTLILIAALPGTALALETEHLSAPDASAVTDEAPQGWEGTVTLGASSAFGHNSRVVGQPDGATTTVSLIAKAAADYTRDAHEWRTNLDITETITRTPVVDRFVKAADNLKLESIYLLHLSTSPHIGPFARFSLETSLFEGMDVRGEPHDYVDKADPNTKLKTASETLKLTDAFKPFKLKESLGVFAQPCKSTPISVEIRLGGGARQTFAGGQLAVDDDDATDPIEVVSLADLSQAGAEIAVEVGGSFSEKRVTYGVGVEVMTPLVTNQADSDDRGAIDLTNLEFGAKISFKLIDWASLDYELKLLREPQLLDDLQVQNNLLLTFAWTLLAREAE